MSRNPALRRHWQRPLALRGRRPPPAARHRPPAEAACFPARPLVAPRARRRPAPRDWAPARPGPRPLSLPACRAGVCECVGRASAPAWFPRRALIAAAAASASPAAMSDYSAGGPPPPSAGPPGAGGGAGAAGPPSQAGGGGAGGAGQAGGAAGPGPGGIRKDAFADAVQRARQVRGRRGLAGGGRGRRVPPGPRGRSAHARVPAGRALALQGSRGSSAGVPAARMRRGRPGCRWHVDARPASPPALAGPGCSARFRFGEVGGRPEKAPRWGGGGGARPPSEQGLGSAVGEPVVVSRGSPGPAWRLASVVVRGLRAEILASVGFEESSRVSLHKRQPCFSLGTDFLLFGG